MYAETLRGLQLQVQIEMRDFLLMAKDDSNQRVAIRKNLKALRLQQDEQLAIAKAAAHPGSALVDFLNRYQVLNTQMVEANEKVMQLMRFRESSKSSVLLAQKVTPINNELNALFVEIEQHAQDRMQGRRSGL